MRDWPTSYLHLKRPAPPDRSDAFAPTLCGREDSGQWYYAALEPGDALPESLYPVCPECATAHAAGPPQGERR